MGENIYKNNDLYNILYIQDHDGFNSIVAHHEETYAVQSHHESVLVCYDYDYDYDHDYDHGCSDSDFA
jgi:hypothetical protein